MDYSRILLQGLTFLNAQPIICAFSKNDFGACRFEGAALRDGHAGEHWLEKRNSRQYKYIAIFYPSSQLCSCCCYHNTETEDLALQEWTCHKCDRRQDRDINTAKNILQEGLSIYYSSAHLAC